MVLYKTRNGTASLRRIVYYLEGNYPVAFCTFDEVEIVSRDFEMPYKN